MLLLVATVVGFSQIFLRPDLFFTQIIVVAIIIGQIMELSNFANKTNTELGRFLAGVRDGDFQLNYQRQQKSKSFEKLYRSFNDVIDTLKELETERNAQNEFLNTIINQIGFGILVFDESQEIILMNNEASELLSIPKVKKWRNLRNRNIGFLETLVSIDRTQNQLLETTIDEESHYFTVNVNNMRLRDRPLKIASFQNIRSEIRQKEIEAWHKLIRILTHETMNSVTPIVSLAETMQMLLTKEDGDSPKHVKDLTEENVLDLRESIQTIEERGEGILRFVSEYRKLTRIPQPELEEVEFSAFLQSTLKLYQPALDENSVDLTVNVPEFRVMIDPVLIQQVVINLVKNSIEALKETEQKRIKIELSGDEKHQRVVQVSDNGPGIPKEKADKIFIPFYTTKQEGSGIGLSVSRQIMSLHGGQLDFKSIPGQWTTFSLKFSS